LVMGTLKIIKATPKNAAALSCVSTRPPPNKPTGLIFAVNLLEKAFHHFQP